MEETISAKEKRAMAGFIVSLIAGTIILAVSLFMTVMMSWMASFVGDFFGDFYAFDLGGLFGAVAWTYGVLGLILGLLVIVGALLIYKRKEVIGGVLVLIGSILSIVAGGGFLLGLVFGIVGGILGILKK